MKNFIFCAILININKAKSADKMQLMLTQTYGKSLFFFLILFDIDSVLGNIFQPAITRRIKRRPRTYYSLLTQAKNLIIILKQQLHSNN